MIQIELNRVEGAFGFEAKDANGHVAKMDTSIEGGGSDFGVRPMQMLLMGLGGCSGIDIVSILQKQRQDLRDIKMKISGQREAGKEPSLWEDVTIHIQLFGAIDPEKGKRAVELSMDKYCSVAETLRRSGCNIKWEVEILP
jgi:putative redox protein